MVKLEYNELKVQNYLFDSDIIFEEKRLIFMFRTRMANFWGNFKGNRPETLCPLCGEHIDCQSLILQCPIVRQQLEGKIDLNQLTTIEDIFWENISERTFMIVKTALDARSKLEQ